jgi:hypothetical protein
VIEVLVRGADAAAKALAASGLTVEQRSARAVAHHGQLLLARIRARASGRPGPRVQTGNYRRSWQVTMGTHGGGPAAVVGTNAPQALRLEYGFVGADSLGRVYDQPPLPHVGPAVQETEPEFVAAMERIARGR